jgi:hypothetical protein
MNVARSKSPGTDVGSRPEEPKGAGMKKFSIVMLVGMAFATGAAFADNQFWIVNGTRSAMIAVQVRPSGQRQAEAWIALAQRGPLGFNERVSLSQISAKCPQRQSFDIQVLFDDGRRLIKTNQFLCSPGTYKVSF